MPVLDGCMGSGISLYAVRSFSAVHFRPVTCFLLSGRFVPFIRLATRGFAQICNLDMGAIFFINDLGARYSNQDILLWIVFLSLCLTSPQCRRLYGDD